MPDRPRGGDSPPSVDNVNEVATASSALTVLQHELGTAMAASKCHRCGCFQEAVGVFRRSATLTSALPGLIEEAAKLFEPVRYECLGCDVCWPALASNAAAEIDPGVAAASHCATAEPALREGWPPLPGDYKVLRFQAPVAVCTLNSDDLVARLTSTRPPGVAMVGALHTENLGIEHVIRNVLPNPNIRFLIVCGDDTRKAIGHLPGQSLVSLMRDGLDEHGRILGAAGKRPVIKNIGTDLVEAFRRRIEVIDLIGETGVELISERIAEAAVRDPGPDTSPSTNDGQMTIDEAVEAKRLISDPAGYVVIYPDRRRRKLVLEHYENSGALTRVLQGNTPAALYGSVIEAGLISRLDHAAYLGRELARAEAALRDGGDYVQDKAAGEIAEDVPAALESSCACSGSCQ